MTPKWDLIGLGGDLGDFWFVVSFGFWGFCHSPQSRYWPKSINREKYFF